MKKAYFLAVAFLLIGAMAFAASDDDFVSAGGEGHGEVSVGFTMDFDNDRDLGFQPIPAIDLIIRVPVANLGTEFQPLTLGVSLLASVGFPGEINWKVPGGEQKMQETKKGNAFFPAGDPPVDTPPEPVRIGAQVLTPGYVVNFAREDCDSLLNVGLLVGLNIQASLGSGLGFVADIGFAGSLDSAVFESDYLWDYYPDYTADPTDKEEVKQTVELTNFNFGIGANLGFQYHMGPVLVELGSGFSLFFSRSASINWYYSNKDGDQRGDALWKEDGENESIVLFRASPYIVVGYSF